MSHVAVHNAPKALVVAHLKNLGHEIRAASTQARYDYLVDDRFRLALRVASPSFARRDVRNATRRYSYVYRAWSFNFHHRGQVGPQYTDFFACIPLIPGREIDLGQAFVIPWKAVRGKTFYLPDSRYAYAGKFARYRNAWHQLRDGPLPD